MPQGQAGSWQRSLQEKAGGGASARLQLNAPLAEGHGDTQGVQPVAVRAFPSSTGGLGLRSLSRCSKPILFSFGFLVTGPLLCLGAKERGGYSCRGCYGYPIQTPFTSCHEAGTAQRHKAALTASLQARPTPPHRGRPIASEQLIHRGRRMVPLL